MSLGHQIARNAGAMALAQVVTLVSGLATTAYLARTLGPSEYGVLRFGLAMLVYATVLVRLGFQTLGTRELARDSSRRAALVSHILSIRLVLFVVALSVYLGCVALLPKPIEFKMAVGVLGGALLGHALSLDWVYQGLQRMGYVVLQQVAGAIVVLLGVILLVGGPEDLVVAAWVTAMGLLAGPVALVVVYWRQFGPVNLAFDRAAWIALLRPALPLAASAFMIALYYNMDQIMLGLLRTDAEVGLYAAGYRLVTAALAPAMVVYTAFLPTLSSAVGDRGLMRARARLHGRVQLAMGLPICVGGTMLAGPLIVLIGGPEYVAGTVALRILMVNMGVVYLNMMFGQPLPAWDLQKRHMYAISVGAVANIILNLVLIPRFGIVGAAVATLASEVAVLIGLATLHYRAVSTLHVDLLLRPLLATTLGVALPCYLGLVADFPLLLTFALVFVAYALTVWVTRTVTLKDLQAIRRKPAEVATDTAE
ncbi:MAG: flippase [Bacteroidota bacterium]